MRCLAEVLESLGEGGQDLGALGEKPERVDRQDELPVRQSPLGDPCGGSQPHEERHECQNEQHPEQDDAEGLVCLDLLYLLDSSDCNLSLTFAI